MQTDILLKQLNSSLEQLKLAIDKFEKHPSPSTQYAEQLYCAISQCNKLVSAFLVLKEQNEISPDLSLHIKLMNVPTPEEKDSIIEPTKEQVIVETVAEKATEVVKPVETIQAPVTETVFPQVADEKVVEKPTTKIAININDKFRFINELFASNSTEYNIAIEQINAVSSLEDLNSYLKGLKSIYGWKDDHEVVKNLYSLSQKRFS